MQLMLLTCRFLVVCTLILSPLLRERERSVLHPYDPLGQTRLQHESYIAI